MSTKKIKAVVAEAEKGFARAERITTAVAEKYAELWSKVQSGSKHVVDSVCPYKPGERLRLLSPKTGEIRSYGVVERVQADHQVGDHGWPGQPLRLRIAISGHVLTKTGRLTDKAFRVVTADVFVRGRSCGCDHLNPSLQALCEWHGDDQQGWERV